jgi:hypothetical protein
VFLPLRVSALGMNVQFRGSLRDTVVYSREDCHIVSRSPSKLNKRSLHLWRRLIWYVYSHNTKVFLHKNILDVINTKSFGRQPNLCIIPALDASPFNVSPRTCSLPSKFGKEIVHKPDRRWPIESKGFCILRGKMQNIFAFKVCALYSSACADFSVLSSETETAANRMTNADDDQGTGAGERRGCCTMRSKGFWSRASKYKRS